MRQQASSESLDAKESRRWRSAKGTCDDATCLSIGTLPAARYVGLAWSGAAPLNAKVRDQRRKRLADVRRRTGASDGANETTKPLGRGQSAIVKAEFSPVI